MSCACCQCFLNEESIYCAPKFWASAVIGISMQKHFCNKTNLLWHVFSSYLANSASEDVCTSFLSFFLFITTFQTRDLKLTILGYVLSQLN